MEREVITIDSESESEMMQSASSNSSASYRANDSMNCEPGTSSRSSPAIFNPTTPAYIMQELRELCTPSGFTPEATACTPPDQFRTPEPQALIWINNNNGNENHNDNNNGELLQFIRANLNEVLATFSNTFGEYDARLMGSYPPLCIGEHSAFINFCMMFSYFQRIINFINRYQGTR